MDCWWISDRHDPSQGEHQGYNRLPVDVGPRGGLAKRSARMVGK